MTTEAMPALRDGANARPARRPSAFHKALLCAYFALLPVTLGSRTDTGPTISPADLLIALLAVAMISSGLKVKLRQWSIWQFLLLLVLAIGLWRAGQAASPSSYAVIQKFGGYIAYLTTYLVIVTSGRRLATAIWMMKALAVSVTLHSGVAILVYVAQQVGLTTASLYNEGDRLSGLLHDPNAYGGLVAVASLFHLGLRATQSYNITNLRFRMALLLADATLPIALFLTYSRTAWIAWLVGILLFALTSWGGSRRLLQTAVCGVAAIAVLLSSSYGATVRELTQREVTITTRQDINRAAFQYFLDDPLLGQGLGTFLAQYGVIVHNTALWFAAEMGAIGLIAFVGYSASYIVRGLRERRRSNAPRRIIDALLCSHIMMVVLSLGIEAFYQRPWWIAVALLGAFSGAAPSTERGSAVEAYGRRSTVNGLALRNRT